MITDINITQEGIEGLIRAGYYKNREVFLEDAFRIMLEVKPQFKLEIAVELYKSEKISLSRAAEIAGVSLEEFKDLLEIKGIKKEVATPTEDEIQRGVDLILGKAIPASL